jgi:hypothetical protein
MFRETEANPPSCPFLPTSSTSQIHATSYPNPLQKLTFSYSFLKILKKMGLALLPPPFVLSV